MKIVSIFLTLLLILPIGYKVFSVFEMRLMQSKFGSSHFTNVTTWQMLSYLLIDVVFIVIAIVLNSKEKYRDNSIMCGTLLLSFLISVIINFASSFLINWLQ